MLTQVVAGDVAQRSAAEIWFSAERNGRSRRGSSVTADASPFMHQARLRFSPSSWAALPPLRSLPVAGRKSAEGFVEASRELLPRQ